MRFLEKFVNQFNLPPLFLSRLDKNFATLGREEEVEQTTFDGYTLKATDNIKSLQVDATAAALTVYLPTSPTGNRRRTITKTDASANAVTVDGNGNNISGAGTYALANQWDSVTVEPTGTEWIVVAFYP